MVARSITGCLLASFLLFSQTVEKPLTGFSNAAAAKQFELETKYERLLNRQNLQQWLKRLSSKPHHVGSPGSREVAEFIASQFRSWGYETKIETFYPLFPEPKVRLVEMVSPTRFTAKLEEPPVEGDTTSVVRDGSLPVYHAYSTDGDVTGDLVYANYGLPDDYKKLREMGIDVKGKLVLVRYGSSWRGIKPKVAAENGAIGCIIYSDPRDDGYFQGDVYPKGAWRPADGAQRGSVMDMPVYPGDPLTPGIPATDAKRVPDPKQAATVTRIPVLPISYGDAEPLLKALAGPVAPAEWRGALPLTYHIGPGPARVHLKLEFDWKLAPTHNVVAKMRGTDFPDQWILRGNHHDGWNFGATDPLSGMISVMEEARAIAELAKTGWRPKRTLIFLAWDGEEPALLGSTEWGEQHESDLRRNAVAYINSDATSRGFVRIAGTGSLEIFSQQAARDVVDPQTQQPVLDRWRAAQRVAGNNDEFRLSALGSGSDYTVFVHHLGIPSLNIGFSGEGPMGGVYHSIYDSYDHFTRFVDPDFQYVLATAQLGGKMVLRLVNADTLPLRVDPVARSVRLWTAELMKLADDLRVQTNRHNELVRSNEFKLAQDVRNSYVAPALMEEVPFLNFAPLMNATTRLDAVTGKLQGIEANKLNAEQLRTYENALLGAEQKLLLSAGLPRRPWFRHSLHAPGFYTGYGVKTLPGVREALEQKNWKEAEAEIQKLAGALEAYAAQLEKAASVMR